MTTPQSPLSRDRRKLPIDPFTLAMLAVVALASLLPARGVAADGLNVATDVGVALLFFLHGAKLSREDVIAGVKNWRLHLLVVALTYAIFPLLTVAFKPLTQLGLTPELASGFLLLGALPSTVQSSIAFTSIARGNVPAAICAASLSNLLGVLLTPLLVALLIQLQGEVSLMSALQKIALLILTPFTLGHLLRPWLGAWVQQRKAVLGMVDRGAILLIVYSAFSESVVNGLWSELSPGQIGVTMLLSALLLAVVLGLSRVIARRLGFSIEDEITIVFCGSKKSLASGMPMARVLFAGHPALGAIVLPMMIFHQLQLMACAQIASRYARRASDAQA